MCFKFCSLQPLFIILGVDMQGPEKGDLGKLLVLEMGQQWGIQNVT